MLIYALPRRYLEIQGLRENYKVANGHVPRPAQHEEDGIRYVLGSQSFSSSDLPFDLRRSGIAPELVQYRPGRNGTDPDIVADDLASQPIKKCIQSML